MFEEIRERYFPVELASGVTARTVDHQVIAAVWAELSNDVEMPFADLGLYTGLRGDGRISNHYTNSTVASTANTSCSITKPVSPLAGRTG